ncbi:GCN5 family acetyltransferase [Desulfosporosinus sp. HMP52]|uniref:GNAT family N-acetyltransferase n=1 Tax=Desulfosporosinus sp. HMP52 TaxID=1487923 RepID=UPI00051FB2FA|nr:GNAT family N-acetyltransferase [Desulfosporosinus sp. HMP52]KGK88124.1 GCN5 family acetyltransferase [Desulfosporosinus sp. HMP52]
MIIRKLKDTDIEELTEIWYKASIIAHNFIPKEMWESHKDELRYKYLPQAETYVAEENNHLLGFISLLENYIGGLFVVPDKQGKGIGKSLLEQAKKMRRQLYVGVYSKNINARKFYINNGFKTVSQEVQEETGEMVINMVIEQ